MSPPVVVLVAPSLPENVGAVARVMANLGVRDLRLVAPRCDPADPRAMAVATSGGDVLARSVIFPTLDAALVGCTGAWAASALPKELQKEQLSPRELGPRLGYDTTALVLGPEQNGLRYEELDRCTGLVHIPTEPGARALNLAQAAGILLWEWRSAALNPSAAPPGRALRPAPLAEQSALVDAVAAALLNVGYLSDPRRRVVALRNLRAAMLRPGFTRAELRSLRGMIAALAR
ncbi:RNA methyltransferase [Deltaproteobacteria bacterium]|nr:RNA methyltransferase [Deltaproteobacteria bacterium]